MKKITNYNKLFLLLLFGWICAIGSNAQTVNFAYTGAPQTYTVPSGVTVLNVVAKGAQGGPYSSSQGGLGGIVTTTLAVTAGQVLYVYVGQQPTTKTGGYNGGGNGGVIVGAGGGGATDIRTAASLTSRLIVAGAGGGAADVNNAAGAGGSTTGANATGLNAGGTGGTSTSGGNLGGALGTGGNAVAVSLPIPIGGGGAGYYGGGGGFNILGAGGGGSSFTDPTLCTNVVHTQGNNTGNGSLSITPAATADINSFITVWKPSNQASFTTQTQSTNTQIRIPIVTGTTAVTGTWEEVGYPAHNGTFTIAANSTSTLIDFGVASNPTATDATYTVKVNPGYSTIQFFDSNSFSNSGDALKIIRVSQWGTNNWTTFSYAFSDCSNLDVTATDVPILSNVDRKSTRLNSSHRNTSRMPSSA